MTGKERLTAALKGEKVDRVPLWPREGLEYKGYQNAFENFLAYWKADPQYKELHDYIYKYADVIVDWSCYPLNRYLLIPDKYISHKMEYTSDDVLEMEGTINTPKGELKFHNEFKRGFITGWNVKHPVEDLKDLMKLAEIPFEIDHGAIETSVQVYNKLYGDLGDKGLIRTFLSSPIAVVSGCMPFELFLELSITEKTLFHELLEEITQRQIEIIDAIFEKHKLDIFVTLGGSEQCTPPMMAPGSFDEYVVPYDKRIIDRLKEYNVLSTCHCHSKVKHALKGMMDAGYVGTDPVEPPPQGDVTFEEARRITDGRLTLFGNLEWTELTHKDPAYIRTRVREILSYGRTRLVVGASAGPISRMDERTMNNYRAWIDAMFEFGS